MAKKKTSAGGISKMEAVRQAMGKLGNAATRIELQMFVQENFGIEMNLDVVSSYKAFITSKAKKTAAKPPATKPVAPKPEAANTPAAKPVAQQPATATKKRKKKKRRKNASKPIATITPASSGKVTGIALNDIQTVKELVKRVGMNTLKGLIDVLSK